MVCPSSAKAAISIDHNSNIKSAWNNIIRERGSVLYLGTAKEILDLIIILMH